MGDGNLAIWLPMTIIGCIAVLALIMCCSPCSGDKIYDAGPRRGRSLRHPPGGLPWVETTTYDEFPTRPPPVFFGPPRGGGGGFGPIWAHENPGYYPGVNILEREPIYGRRA